MVIIDRVDYRQGKFLMLYYANWQRGGVTIDRVFIWLIIDRVTIERGQLYLTSVPIKVKKQTDFPLHMENLSL